MNTPKQDLVQVQLTVNITFDANGEDHEWLRANAHKAVTREFGNGGITGGSDAVVEDYSIEAKILSPEAAALDEESLTKWLSQQIEDGHMELERLPMLMARYALTDTVSMREEMAERMQGLASGDKAFLIDEGWGHIFAGNTEKTTRWVVDRRTSSLVAAQVETRGKWDDLTQAEAEDLAESLRDNDVLEDVDLEACEAELPTWAEDSDKMNINLSPGQAPSDHQLTAPQPPSP